MTALILEPAELESLMKSEAELLLVDLSKAETYAAAHLPGAVHVEPSSIVSGIKPAVGKLPDESRLNDVLGEIGYQADRHVIAYDDEGGGWAGRFLWTLSVIGHERFSLLNGGLVAWMAEERPVTNEAVSVSRSDVHVHIDTAQIATRDEIMELLGSQEMVIWDARSVEEFLGEKKFAERGGHIPGAINFDWLGVMDRNSNLKVRDDIQDALDHAGITRDKRVITHCQTHHRSGLTWLVGRALGYDIRAYDGSWSEWGNDPDTPVEASTAD